MEPGELSRTYLRRHCPLAWNTPDRQDIYTRLGFDMIGELFRIVQDYLGDDRIDPEHLPLRVDVRFSITATHDAPIIRLAKRQTGDIEPDPNPEGCYRPKERPPLCAAYLEERMPTAWEDPDARHAYAVFGYAIEQYLISLLIEQPVEAAQTTRAMAMRLDTTLAAGGCSIVCAGSSCAHVHPH